ncbi:MAG: diheme cytochrome c [Gammaproteobacteria bacterium]|nr:diheme cytochrome c [Gammaproteobacteria bacterium]
MKKNKLHALLLSSVSLTLFLSLFVLPGIADADDDDHHDRDKWSVWKKKQVNTTNPEYTAECGSCHLAYPPRFLSSEAWQKIMANLENHFNDNAELDSTVNAKITDFLVSNSSSNRWSSNTDMRTLRISNSRHFIRKHHEVPNGAVGPNAQVKSYSNCKACHPKADADSFREREIKIPGFRFWD